MILSKAKMPAERRLELVHVSLMREKRFAFFAGLFMVGKTSIVDLPITARTNGRDAEYGRAFVDTLNDRELAFLVLHENIHKCYRHLTTWRSLFEKDSRKANHACDYVINIQLVDMDREEKFIAMPRDKKTHKPIGLVDTKYRGMDAKQVWDILRDEECGGGGGNEQSDGGSESSGGGDAGLDEHDWEGARQLTAEEQKAKVDWREVLRRFVRTSLKDRDSPSWRRAHKRYLWQDIILPSIVGKRMKHLAVGIDTSGSIQGDLLASFMGELNKAVTTVNPDRVDIMYWDTVVAGHEVYKGSNQNITTATKPKGGGGTDPDCVPTFMGEKKIAPDALIMLTDGYMSSDASRWSGVGCPILWCVIGNTDLKIPKGQVVRVERD